jgi:HD-like signal output (HDOD) protein
LSTSSTVDIQGDALEDQVRTLALEGGLKIPPYPGVALKLQKIIGDGNYGMAELARVASSDAVLSATILRMANSAYYRGLARVITVSEAINRLGADELCRLALAVSLGGVAATHGPLAELRRATWRQSLGSGLCCQVLAPLRLLPPQQAFLCGLLHDFGRVVTLASLEELIPARATASLDEAEWLGIVDRLHVEVGTLVAQRWNLPELLVDVIANHHKPEIKGQPRPYVDLVNAADQVVMMLEDCPYLLGRDLLGLPGLRSRQEIDALMLYMPLIPGYISGLDETVTPGGSPGDTAVEKPPTMLDGERSEVDFPVTWARANSEVMYKARFLTAKGIAIAGLTQLYEGTVVRLRVGGSGVPIDLSGRVVLCRPEQPRGFYIEVKLFVLPGAAQAWWSEVSPGTAEPPPAA